MGIKWENNNINNNSADYFVIYGCDFHQDRTVDFEIESLFENDSENFFVGNYIIIFNRDGLIDMADEVFADNNG